MKKTSSFQNSLIWFGAAVSIAEILTGTYFAPLGFTKGLLAILVGHVIGCAMFFFAGLIGGRTGRSAMGTVELSFGRIGCLFFAALNVLQLVGWTAIMIYDGALATNTVLGIGKWVWCLVIGGLIVVWIAVGIKNLSWINKIAMAALFILSIVLCVVVFRGGTPVTAPDDSLSFGAAVELAVAMPLSWLPLISDYTREAEKPFAATLSSTLTYGVVSCWMYVIGTVCAICFPMDDITNFLYLIGSVFAPMIAIQITDFFLLRRGGVSGRLDVCNAVVWVLGFVLYRVLMTVDIPVGNTLPDMAGTMLLCLIAHKIVPDKTRAA